MMVSIYIFFIIESSYCSDLTFLDLLYNNGNKSFICKSYIVSLQYLSLNSNGCKR